ncbi:PspC domain-containing protein [Lapillicoccus sp.]|uniref:PspC domain-containing protein n=1 Tax=Lapillicoccus sp. TaxID=1909287 RepID=UPI0032675D75
MDETEKPTSRQGLDGLFAWLRATGLQRRGDDKWVGGVCGALARRLNVDPILVRGAFLLFIILGGVGVLLYLVGWALLPNDQDEVLAQKAIHGDGRGIVLLVAIAVSLVSGSDGNWWLWLVLVPLGFFLWWVIRSALAGKSSHQMGEEASAFTNRIAARVGGSAPARPIAPGTPGMTSTTGVTGLTSTAAPTSAPHGMGPGRTGVVELPPRVVQSRRPRAGILGLLLTAGLAVAAYGLGSMLATNRDWPGSPPLIGAAFALVGAGVALVLIGAVGRRAGFSGFLVAVLAVVAVAATGVPALPAGGFGDRTWSAASQPAGGFTLTAGDARLDLTGAAPGSTVKVDMGAGQLTVTVPAGMTASVSAAVNAGQVRVNRAGNSTTIEAGANPAQARSIVVGTGVTKVSLDVALRAGELRIVEEAS